MRNITTIATAGVLAFLLVQTPVVTGQAGPAPCPAPAYLSVPAPDKVDAVWTGRKRYRLVIGVGEYDKDPSYNRSFVTPTANLVDQALNQAGYTQSLGLLTGSSASRNNIKNALLKLGTLPEDALVVVYYIGHGLVAPSKDDIALQVADEPVDKFNGVDVKQYFAEAVASADSRFQKIPRIIFVFESCHSGGAAPFVGLPHDSAASYTRLVFLSATDASQEAHLLKGQPPPGVSAFGYFFARAIRQDWACTDQLADGAITVQELRTYIWAKLKDATANQLLDGPMSPRYDDPSDYSMMTYDPHRVGTLAGYRDAIVEIYLKPDPGVNASISFGSKKIMDCGGECRVSTDSVERATVRLMRPGFGAGVIPGDQLKALLTTETHSMTVSSAGTRGGGPAGTALGTVEVRR
jgi:hypothetical protein